MSRFFKSAAFPILIVVVLAFFAQKLIGSNSHGPNYTFGNLLTQLDQKGRQEPDAGPEVQQRSTSR